MVDVLDSRIGTAIVEYTASDWWEYRKWYRSKVTMLAFSRVFFLWKSNPSLEGMDQRRSSVHKRSKEVARYS